MDFHGQWCDKFNCLFIAVIAIHIASLVKTTDMIVIMATLTAIATTQTVVIITIIAVVILLSLLLLSFSLVVLSFLTLCPNNLILF